MDRRTLLLAVLSLAGCDVREDAAAPVPWEVQARAALRVVVTDPEGSPLQGAWVALEPSGRDQRTDDDGEARLLRLAPGAYQLEVGAPGFATERRQVVVSGTTSTEVTLTPLALDGHVVGTVVGPEGAPVVGAPVLVDDVERARTGLDGTFDVVDLPAGAVALSVGAPEGSTLLPVTVDGLDLGAAEVRPVHVVLPARPPDDASYIGSAPCGFCHAEQAAKWEQSAHAEASRAPDDLVGDPSGLDLAFALGATVPLDGGGAVANLGQDGAGAWWVEVRDGAGTTTGTLPVQRVYGGHRHGAALAVQVGSTWALAPVAWVAAGGGLGSAQTEAGWQAAWTEGWLGQGRLRVVGGDVPAEASMELRCGGCHASAFVLEEQAGAWSLERADTQPGPVERVVGCEACHGPGSVHRRSSDARARSMHDPGDRRPADRLEVCARCHERVTVEDHPFSALPEHPVLPDGRSPEPWGVLSDVGPPARVTWEALDASVAPADEVGDLRSSPHRLGPAGYLGSCEDCHDPHGSEHPVGLRTDPWDNALCTGCHAAAFPDDVAEALHARHGTFSTGPWAPGSCIGCHMQRSAILVSTDARSGVGEARAHDLVPWSPDDVLATFEAASTDRLPPGAHPVNGCIDCHLQRQAAAEDVGAGCPCPQGDPGWSLTWTSLAVIWDRMFGGQP